MLVVKYLYCTLRLPTRTGSLNAELTGDWTISLGTRTPLQDISNEPVGSLETVTGLEPVLFAVKGRCLCHFDYTAV